MTKTKGGDDQPPEEPFHNPFRVLRDKLGNLPSGPQPRAPGQPAPSHLPLPSRAILRIERKGRAGKEVTCLELRDLGRSQLGPWLKELKQRLGCGGSLEGETLVLQGDQRDRLQSLLIEQGLKSVTLG